MRSWRVTADFTYQRSCICTLMQNASQRSVTREIYSLRLLWQLTPLRYSLITSYIYNTNQTVLSPR